MFVLIEAASKKVVARFRAEELAIRAGKSMAKSKKKAMALLHTGGGAKPIARFYPIGVVERAKAPPVRK
jgi:hypothetical protein